MILYVVRHGIAVDTGEGVRSDADRFLSDKGRKRTNDVARALAKMECRPERIVTSPLLRAAQTAGILAKRLHTKRRVLANGVLAPGVAVNDVVDWLASLKASSVMIVGHMPGLGRVIAALLSSSADVAVVFKKAAVCCISFDKGVEASAGRLEWLMQPKQLRAIA